MTANDIDALLAEIDEADPDSDYLPAYAIDPRTGVAHEIDDDCVVLDHFWGVLTSRGQQQLDLRLRLIAEVAAHRDATE